MVVQVNGVFLCKDIKNLKEKINLLFKDGKESISICPFYNIKKEYRCFYLNGEVLLIYGKERPFVIGDGKNKIEKLIDKNDVIIDGIDSSYIPKQNEKVYISWKHNLTGGAIPEILKECELYHKIEKIALDAAKAINITFATIDIIQTDDNMLYVMEINSGVGTTKFSELIENGNEITKNIYRKALQLLFEK